MKFRRARQFLSFLKEMAIGAFVGFLALKLFSLFAWLQASCSPTLIIETKSLNCTEFWLNRYQTLISGIIALAAAMATIFAVRYQTLSADRAARRTEHDAENALRSIVKQRTAIFAEVWRGIDWVFESGTDKTIIEKRANAIWAVYWHSGEDRIEYEKMNTLQEFIVPSAKVKISHLLLAWGEMLDHLDTVPDEHSLNPDFVHWLEILRIKFSFITLHLERYDPLLTNVFVGLRQPHVNPGHTPTRIAAVRDAMRKNCE